MKNWKSFRSDWKRSTRCSDRDAISRKAWWWWSRIPRVADWVVIFCHLRTIEDAVSCLVRMTATEYVISTWELNFYENRDECSGFERCLTSFSAASHTLIITLAWSFWHVTSDLISTWNLDLKLQYASRTNTQWILNIHKTDEDLL